MKARNAIVAALTLAVCLMTQSASAEIGECDPVEAALFTNRVHVLCKNHAVGLFGEKIWYFAVPTSGTTLAGRFLDLTTKAMADGMRLMVEFGSWDKTGENFGCNYNDCRNALSIRVVR